MTELRIKNIEIIPGAGINVLGEEVEVHQLLNGGTIEQKVKGYARPIALGDFATPEAAQAAIAARMVELTGPEFALVVADAAVARMELAQARADKVAAETARDQAETAAAEKNNELAALKAERGRP